jgi:hypothetical protein
MQARFSSLFRLTRIRRRMFQSTEAGISCNNLSIAVTYDHVDSASSPHLPLVNGRDKKIGERDRYNTDTLRPVALEDSGAGNTSPRAALLVTPMPVAPCETPPTPDTPSTGATTSRGEPGVTTARPPVLVVDDTIKGKHRSITEDVAD